MSPKAKALTVEKVIENRDQNGLKDLRQQIESLATIMKSATVGSGKPKVTGGVSGVSGGSPQKPFQGSHRKIKGPLKPGQMPIKCYCCDDWGHGWQECPNSGKLKLEGTGRSCSSLISCKSWLHSHPNPKSKSMIYKILRQSNLYHNLDLYIDLLVILMDLLFWLKIKKPELLLTLVFNYQPSC